MDMEMDCSTSHEFFTHFEDLSNEIIYEIFEYLHFHYLYQTFAHLNNRFNNLIHNSTLPIKLYLPSISHKAFQNYCKDIIIPNQHRIGSIYSTNPFLFDLPPTPFRYLFQFPRLHTLILENFESENLRYLLPQLSALSNLSSLTIKPLDEVRNTNCLYQQIFSLPVLRYCKVSFQQRLLTIPLPVCRARYSQIQHLIIENQCCLKYLIVILSYVPQLCRLSCPHLRESTLPRANQQQIVLRHLTHLSFGITNIVFANIQSFFAKLSHQLQVFRLSTAFNLTYANAQQWEQLILVHLPNLRIFDLQLISEDSSNQVIPALSISQFMTSFWFQRQWFFRYEYERTSAAFYSIKPYRRKVYALNNRSYRETQQTPNTPMFPSVNHISLRGDISTIRKNFIVFPNVVELTLADYSNESLYSISMILDRLISLTKLHKLFLRCPHFCISQLMDLLYFSPNIRTLIIQSVSLAKISLTKIRQTQTFQTIFKDNRITNVTLTEDSTMEAIELFYYLCPRLEQLTIDLVEYDPTIIKTSLGPTIGSHHVPVLCLLNADPGLHRILRADLPHDCCIKSVDSDVYIWS